jgi:hypothetical protein
METEKNRPKELYFLWQQQKSTKIRSGGFYIFVIVSFVG